MPRKLAAGNWKMNGLRSSLVEIQKLAERHSDTSVDVLICPPATLIEACRGLLFDIGGQDCHTAQSGAHTGDISAEMLSDAGATYVLTGHSERRTDHGETNATVAAKSQAAYDAGLTAVICIGETLAEREDGTTLDVIDQQLAQSVPDTATADNTVIAYEPVWAIGTGKVPSSDQIAEVHSHIRARMLDRFADGADMRLLYGGSVKGSNAAEIFSIANVDGALVGGASLKADDFSAIINALEES
ncbi:triose-phosphate isomerase [Yoonia sediminilitoris]|uniref:Triosephosphate isomerase n=1 Tax=Yoonia sediminilitoris TaxID=1286148 RepID=A0A2T6KRC4_9RHOB|nr:triose-phosphate isomerase [Yoonia sediminilitoris]PUB19103.1 triosephosphate isomerase [Yoonia sediminilitoris]RCW99271.1 triosephosphate isomerase [Yoonia sediminilitoris]